VNGKSYWFVKYSFPITLPIGPLNYLDESFDQLFVKTEIYNNVDKYLRALEKQYGTFWVSSPGGGYGKSTMLNYITRKLYLELKNRRALPFHVSIVEPFESVKHAFVKGFLESFLNIANEMKQFPNIPQDIQGTVIEDFKRYDKKVRILLEELPGKSPSELETIFKKALNILYDWNEKGIFHKYVLLVDEMDKLNPDDVLNFFAKNQHLFEELYQKYKFVIFFSGHRSWVERIHKGTEYSFYRGIIFDIQPLVDLRDIKRLIESRLIQYAHMHPADIPWTEEGYEKLRELTDGIPRDLILLARDVTNEAYERKISQIGPGIIEEVISSKCSRIAEPYLRKNPQMYEKLKKAIDASAVSLLYIFYEYSPDHGIPKNYDNDLESRVRYLGVEFNDKQWNEKIEILMRYGCLEDRGVKRVLSDDVAKFFDILRREGALKPEIVSQMIRKFRDVIISLPKKIQPDFLEAMNRPFKINPDKWYTENELLEWFRDETSVSMYINDQIEKRTKIPKKVSYKKEYEKLSRKLFSKWLPKYIKQMQDKIMILEENGQKVYRKLPDNMNYSDYQILRKVDPSPREIIDNYINLVIKPREYNLTMISKLNKLIEKLIISMGSMKGTEIKPNFLRKRTRARILKSLGIPEQLRRFINIYITSSKEPPFSTGIIKEVAKHIILNLAKIFVDIQEQFLKEEYELLKQLELDLRKLIEEKLSKISKRWWKERIPPDIRKNAEERKKKEERLWPWIQPGRDYSLIHYINFSEYSKIITRKDNWKDVFKDIFKDEKIIEVRLKEIDAIRNKIAHFRPLTDTERKKLKLYADEILNCIRTHIKNY